MDLNNARLPPQLDLAYSEGHEDSDNESVTDEDIQQLLQDAAQRLREKANAEKSMTVGKVVVPKLPTVGAYDVANIYVRTEGDIAHADPGRLLDKSSRELSNKVRKVEDPIIVKQRKLERKKATAGSNWYNLPRTELTPELKRDLQLLKMRNVLDPHRHYKKDNTRDIVPEFSQVGTIIEGPTEFFSSRVVNKDRKRTIVDEILAGEIETGKFRRKYDEIQAAKTSGKKAHWKALKEKRKAGRIYKR